MRNNKINEFIWCHRNCANVSYKTEYNIVCTNRNAVMIFQCTFSSIYLLPSKDLIILIPHALAFHPYTSKVQMQEKFVFLSDYCITNNMSDLHSSGNNNNNGNSLWPLPQ